MLPDKIVYPTKIKQHIATANDSFFSKETLFKTHLI